MPIEEVTNYPGFVTPNFQPFDPLELAQLTEKIVGQGDSRKYTAFYCTGVYGGISTGYLVGCCLRCVFCWVSLAREFPQKFGRFYNPEEVAGQLIHNAQKRRVERVRISGGEPTICKQHLLRVLDLVSQAGYSFVLETNGILLGKDPEYVAALTKYDNLYLRICLKAGTPEGFQKRTGARSEFYELPYLAIKYALKENLYFRVAAMSDQRLMPGQERRQMLQKLKQIGYRKYLEEEICDPYDTTLIRLRKAGLPLFQQE